MQTPRTGKHHYCPSCKGAVDAVDTVCLNCEASRPPHGWPVDPFVGRVLGKKYRIDRRFSVGGFGMVFLATQVHQGQDLGRVIIKMLHPEHAFDPVVTKRFINEVKAARSITNPHVVRVFDMDFDQGNIPYMVQEFVEGEGLADILERVSVLDLGRALAIGIQVAEGLDEAHQKGIVHRDLKPENVLLQTAKRSDWIKLIDFGIASIANREGQVTTSFVGTPRYMPPEQIKGKEIDGRADIYALGVILYEMIAGRPPIRITDSDMEYLTLNVTRQPDRLSDAVPGIPEALDELVDAMLAKDPDDRPATMGDVARALDAVATQGGYKLDITGEQRLPQLSPKLAGAVRALVETPSTEVDDPTQPDRHRRPTLKSDPFTDERPVSAQHDAASRGPRIPLVAILAGAAAVLVVLLVGAVVIALVASNRTGNGRRSGAGGSGGGDAQVQQESSGPAVEEEPGGGDPGPAGEETPASSGATDAGSAGEDAGPGTDEGDGDDADPGRTPDPGAGQQAGSATVSPPVKTDHVEGGTKKAGGKKTGGKKKKTGGKKTGGKKTGSDDPWTKI